MHNDCMLLYLLNDKALQKVFLLILEREKKYFAICKKQQSSIRKHSGNREVYVFLNVPVFVIC